MLRYSRRRRRRRVCDRRALRAINMMRREPATGSARCTLQAQSDRIDDELGSEGESKLPPLASSTLFIWSCRIKRRWPIIGKEEGKESGVSARRGLHWRPRSECRASEEREWNVRCGHHRRRDRNAGHTEDRCV